jgi:prenyl protein peptidase
MPPVWRIAAVSKHLKISPLRQISSTPSRISSASPPFPIVAACPSPTCACAETPASLDIDRKRDLNGSMAPYKQHVVVSTGKSDWTSRIEDGGLETPWGDLVRKLKAMLGRGGKYSDVCRYVFSLCYIGRPETTVHAAYGYNESC